MPIRESQKEKKIEGNISLSRVNSNVEDDYALIAIQDRANYNQLIRVKLSLRELGKLITGVGDTRCQIDIIADMEAIENLGLERDILDASVPFESDKEIQRSSVHKTFRLFYEQAGWKLLSDGINKRQDGIEHQFSMYRYKEKRK